MLMAVASDLAGMLGNANNTIRDLRQEKEADRKKIQDLQQRLQDVTESKQFHYTRAERAEKELKQLKTLSEGQAITITQIQQNKWRYRELAMDSFLSSKLPRLINEYTNHRSWMPQIKIMNELAVGGEANTNFYGALLVVTLLRDPDLVGKVVSRILPSIPGIMRNEHNTLRTAVYQLCSSGQMKSLNFGHPVVADFISMMPLNVLLQCWDPHPTCMLQCYLDSGGDRLRKDSLIMKLFQCNNGCSMFSEFIAQVSPEIRDDRFVDIMKWLLWHIPSEFHTADNMKNHAYNIEADGTVWEDCTYFHFFVCLRMESTLIYCLRHYVASQIMNQREFRMLAEVDRTCNSLVSKIKKTMCFQVNCPPLESMEEGKKVERERSKMNEGRFKNLPCVIHRNIIDKCMCPEDVLPVFFKLSADGQCVGSLCEHLWQGWSQAKIAVLLCQPSFSCYLDPSVLDLSDRLVALSENRL